MGNSSSSERRCGLCYFKLKPDTPFLEQPTVSRRVMPVYPQPPWDEGSLDFVLESPKKALGRIESMTKLRALDISAERGCGGCAAIKKCLLERIANDGWEIDEQCLETECRFDWWVGDARGGNVSLVVQPMAKNPSGRYLRARSFGMTIEYYGRKYRESFLCVSGHADFIFVSVTNLDPYPAHPSAFKASEAGEAGNTGSAASLLNLKTWLKACDGTHPGCNPPPSSLPHRVLELSKNRKGDISTRLVQGLDSNEPYACLSHRWGPSTLRCRTVNDNLSAHLQSVPWEKLPKTFQQAAGVAMHLGIRYIWIDSLCIIQDNAEDWKTQAAQMCSIYHGSRITIAATCSADSDHGIFRTVPKLPITTAYPRDGQVFIRNAPGHSSNPREGPEEAAKFPLLTRGWVYQERLLASRVVHFGRDELTFECGEAEVWCECGMNVLWLEKNNHRRTLNDTDLGETRRHWYDLVSSFSALDLTFYSDSLPALAGIARQHGEAHKDMLGQYVAGLWKQTLIPDLIWYVEDGYASARPENCLAPTWSWASKSGGNSWLAYARTAESDMEVVDYAVDLAGPDEYGPVKSADLTLRGYLAPGTWEWRLQTSINMDRVHFVADSGSANTYYLHLDYNFSDEKSHKYIAPGSRLYIMKTGFTGSGNHVCLVLRVADEEKRVFERVGLLREAKTDDVSSWFENGAEMEAVKLL